MNVCMYVCMYGHHVKQSMDHPGIVVNSSCGQLNRETECSLSPFAPENLVSRDGFSAGSSRICLIIPHITKAEPGAYSRAWLSVTASIHTINPPSGQSRVPSGHVKINCVPMAFTDARIPTQPVVLKVARVVTGAGCSGNLLHGPVSYAPLSPHSHKTVGKAGICDTTRGHKVEKHHSKGENVRHSLHTKIKRQWYKKYSEKRHLSPKKQKEERKKHVWVSGRLHIEERLNEGPRLQ